MTPDIVGSTVEGVRLENAPQSAQWPVKLCLASPSYGPTDPYASKCIRVAVMHAARNGVVWCADVSPDRMGWAAARNAAVEAALTTDADGIMWIDSDTVPPVDAITRLVGYGLDFVSGVYFQRRPPYNPVVARYDTATNKFNWLVKWPEGVLFKTDGVGFGCCFTSMDLIRRMKAELPEVAKDGWFQYNEFSEDFTFCQFASRVGSPPHVDTALFCTHLGDPEEITVDTFRAKNPHVVGTALVEEPHNG